MNEILPGIVTWSWFSERHGYDFHGTLVRHPEGNLCVDPVQGPDEVLDWLAREGVSRIVLTNRNHTRMSAKVRERTRAPIAIHPADAAHAREQGVEADLSLEPGDAVGPFRVVAAGGKSPGEIALYSPERRILIVGDACVGKPPGALALLPGAVIDDLPALQESLRRLAELDIESILTGDGWPILTGGQAALRALVATF